MTCLNSTVGIPSEHKTISWSNFQGALLFCAKGEGKKSSYQILTEDNEIVEPSLTPLSKQTLRSCKEWYTVPIVPFHRSYLKVQSARIVSLWLGKSVNTKFVHYILYVPKHETKPKMCRPPRILCTYSGRPIKDI